MAKNTKKQKVATQSFGKQVLKAAREAVKRTLAEKELLLKLQKIRNGK